jgi:hypothetical protein
MSAPICPHFHTCNAPVCSLDLQSLAQCAWFPHEETCHRPDLHEIRSSRHVQAGAKGKLFECQKELSDALAWLCQRASRINYRQATITLVVHRGRVVRIERALVEREIPNPVGDERKDATKRTTDAASQARMPKMDFPSGNLEEVNE